MLFERYLEQNKEFVIESKLKINNLVFSKLLPNIFLPYEHRRPVKPSEQLHINPG